MGKIPYMPLYIGDWEQDTNCLSLEAEGAWLKVVFKCWKNKGIFQTTLDSLARLCRVTPEKFATILLEWKLNDICNITEREDGAIMIVCRRHIKDIENSAKKAINGSKGGSKTQAKLKQKEKSTQAKNEQIPEYDIDIENESEFENNKKEPEKKFTQPDVSGDEIVFPIDTPVMRTLWAAWKESRWKNHEVIYGMHGEQSALSRLQGMNFKEIENTIKPAIEGRWKNLYPESTRHTGNGNGFNKKEQQTRSNREAFKNIYGGKPAE
jgi:uncharacterized protein YdaU (DUF1376 family)